MLFFTKGFYICIAFFISGLFGHLWYNKSSGCEDEYMGQNTLNIIASCIIIVFQQNYGSVPGGKKLASKSPKCKNNHMPYN